MGVSCSLGGAAFFIPYFILLVLVGLSGLPGSDTNRAGGALPGPLHVLGCYMELLKLGDHVQKCSIKPIHTQHCVTSN